MSLDNKIKFNTERIFVLVNIFNYCRFASYSEFAFQWFINFEEC